MTWIFVPRKTSEQNNPGCFHIDSTIYSIIAVEHLPPSLQLPQAMQIHGRAKQMESLVSQSLYSIRRDRKYIQG